MQKSRKRKREEADEGPRLAPVTGPEHTGNTEPAPSESMVSRLTSWFNEDLYRVNCLEKCPYQIQGQERTHKAVRTCIQNIRARLLSWMLRLTHRSAKL